MSDLAHIIIIIIIIIILIKGIKVSKPKAKTLSPFSFLFHVLVQRNRILGLLDSFIFERKKILAEEESLESL